MILWILSRMEHNPNATFSKYELKDRFPQEFQTAIQEGLLHRIASNPSNYRYEGKTYYILRDQWGLEAINEDEPDDDPIPLTEEDLFMYRLDLNALALKIQEKNQLSEKPSAINHRLYFLGESASEDFPIPYILVLFNGSPDFRSTITEILLRMPRKYSKFVAVFPSYKPTLEEERHFEDLNIFTTNLGSHYALPSVDTIIQKNPQLSVFKLTPASVTWRTQTYSLTKSQYLVIDCLFRKYQSGTRHTSWNEICNYLESHDLHPSRLLDVFKRSPLWKTLIVSERRGVYYLDI